MTTMTEEECARRIGLALQDAERVIAGLRTKLRETDLRACIAEWAIAGVLSRQLSLKVAVDGTTLATKLNDAIEMSRHMGKNAGMQFLHGAELAFTQHAEYSQMMSERDVARGWFDRHNSAEFKVAKEFWPRPFP